jgi:hypothetical protein
MTELAEGARLEIVCLVKSGTVGSNPTLSAMNPNGCGGPITASAARDKGPLVKVFGSSKIYDSRVLRNGTLPTPSGPEGSSGRNTFRVPQGCLAITSYRLRACPIRY